MNYISHLLEDASMRKLTAETGMGVESIDFSIAENLDQFEQTMQTYERRLAQIDAPSLTIHGPFLDLNPMAFDSMIQQATFTRYNQAYEAAYRLGAKKLILHSGFIPSVYFLEGWAERMADFYNRFLEDKSEKIQILMENVLDPYPEPLREVAERVKHPAFGICLDVGHAHCYSDSGRRVMQRKDAELRNSLPDHAQAEKDAADTEAPGQWISVLKPYIRHLHLHDNTGERDSHLAAGDGNIKWEPVRKLLRQGVEYTLECRTPEDVLKSQKYLL